MPLGGFMSVRDTVTMWEHRGTYRSLVMIPNISLGVLLIFMQFFWYYLIWKKLFKILGKIISPQASTEKKDS